MTGPLVTAVDTAVYVIPTDAPEADGTLTWDSTTMVLVTLQAGEELGLGWSYASAAAQTVIHEVLADVVVGRDAFDIAAAAEAMARQVRNIGLQLDVTRCGGITEFLRGASLAAAHNLQVSGHCAPNLHAHVGAAVPKLRHVEYFHDHQRIEQLFFDGTLDPSGGSMRPDRDRPGHGMALRGADTERYRRT